MKRCVALIGLILSLHKSVCMVFFFPLFFFFLELRFRAARLSFATVAQNSVCNYQLFFFLVRRDVILTVKVSELSV